METATEKIIRLLLLHPKKEWQQITLASRAGCSKAFVSKIAGKFIDMGSVVKIKRNILMINPTKLLNYWCGIRKLPGPVYVKTGISHESVLTRVKECENYALTLYSSAWLRTGFLKTDSIEVYVLKKDAESFVKKFGIKSEMPTKFIILPSDSDIFEGCEKINGINTVSPMQNYVDLMVIGGQGARAANALSRKYNLWGID